jgi:hypothetical protein
LNPIGFVLSKAVLFLENDLRKHHIAAYAIAKFKAL